MRKVRIRSPEHGKRLVSSEEHYMVDMTENNREKL